MATLTSAVRYFQPGTTKIVVAAAYATIANIAAGTDVSADVAAINGFTTATADLPVPSLGASFTGSIPGRKTADGSSIDFYASATGADIRAVLTEGQNTFIVILANGLTSGGAMDVYPVRVASLGTVRDLEGVPVIRANFTITSAPTEHSTYPAS
jgi:hypothetical protein